LTIACLATTPLVWLVTTGFSRRGQPAYLRSREQMDDLVLLVSETIQGVHVGKGFADGRDGQQRISAHVSRYTPSIDVFSHANVVSLLGYGGVLVAQGRLTLGDLVVFAGLLQQLSTQVTTMSTIVNTLQESLIGARRVFEVLDAPVEAASPPAAPALESVRGAIRF